ncbi:hypothetical protein ZEAMMB73_Zm00001d034265 [Zea mays]|jgi:hypothetical protein|uniref:Uncharacterized protein n=2 Tax=Zea mays TaxID=4577 RepID=A0A1D6L6H1_MAIZE|nr:hypothetical protein ZEAMMB73_Zm00001d034265 [Zea mays]
MAAMEEDWIFIGDGAGGSSDTDSASDDDDSGFMIVRRGRKGGDHRFDAAAHPRVAAVAVAMPQPTPPGPGLSFRVVSSDGGGRREHPGCNDEPSESFHDDIDNDRSDTEDDFSGSDEEAENGNRDIFHMLFPRATGTACDANIDNYEDESEHGYIDDDEEDEDGSSFDIDSSDGEEEAATATAACDWYNAEDDDGIADVAENGNQDIFDMLLPRERTIDDAAMTTANIFRMLFPRAKACVANIIDGDSEDGSEHRYIDYEAEFGMLLPRECAIIDDYEDESEHVYIDYEAEFGMLLPRERALFTSAAQSGPAEALFTFTVRSRERALVAIEEVRRRREAAQQELDRALARQAAAAAEALESALRGGTTTAKRQATGVTQPAVADLDAPADFNFIIGVCMFVYLVVSLFL